MKGFTFPYILIMKYTILIIALLGFCLPGHAQFEPWSDPVALTDMESINSNPTLLVFETASYLFYEKQDTPDGPVKIYYRDIKNMGPEQELLGESDADFRNPVLKWDYGTNPTYFLIYESNLDGPFNIYALEFDAFLNFGDSYQLTFSSSDKNNTSWGYWSNDLCWDSEEKIMVADLLYTSDTAYLSNTQTIDSQGGFDPELCESRLIYHKNTSGSTAIYASDWNYATGLWDTPYPIDDEGYNTFCHCSVDAWWYTWGNCLIYEKEGFIYNYFSDDIYELSLPEFYGEAHEPHSAIYAIPVDNIPAPLFIAFQSGVSGQEDIYAVYTEFGISDVINLSDDAQTNSNPRLAYGWYANDPCSMYILAIWETQQNGNQALYMSKTPVYVCGAIDEQENVLQLETNPNPFSETLKIRFRLSDPEPVKVALLTWDGQLLWERVHRPDPSGWVETTFKPEPDLSPGILYIRLTQGKQQLFRKVIYK